MGRAEASKSFVCVSASFRFLLRDGALLFHSFFLSVWWRFLPRLLPRLLPRGGRLMKGWGRIAGGKVERWTTEFLWRLIERRFERSNEYMRLRLTWRRWWDLNWFSPTRRLFRWRFNFDGWISVSLYIYIYIYNLYICIYVYLSLSLDAHRSAAGVCLSQRSISEKCYCFWRFYTANVITRMLIFQRQDSKSFFGVQRGKCCVSEDMKQFCANECKGWTKRHKYSNKARRRTRTDIWESRRKLAQQDKPHLQIVLRPSRSFSIPK